MDRSLSLLLKVACLVIIAAGTYFFWQEYEAWRNRATRDREEHVARTEQLTKDLFDAAGAKSDETIKVKNYCRFIERGVSIGRLNQSGFMEAVNDCRALGFL